MAVELGIDHLVGLEMIGRGGFGAVYAATDIRFDRRVAVKVLGRSLSDKDRLAFERECRIMGRMSAHPNVVTVYEAGYTPTDTPYLVMELVEGGSLADRLHTVGPLPWAVAVQVAIPVAEALGLAHAQGIEHRDVKPENILMAGDQPKLTDFGIARLRDSTGATSTHITASWLHTPPETFGNKRDERSDIYSLVSTLQTLITGRAPFHSPDDESLSPLMYRLLNQPPPVLPPELGPPALAEVLRSGLAKDPAQRPQTTGELVDRLRQVVGAVGASPAPLPLGSDDTSRIPVLDPSATVVSSPYVVPSDPSATVVSSPYVAPPGATDPSVQWAPPVVAAGPAVAGALAADRLITGRDVSGPVPAGTAGAGPDLTGSGVAGPDPIGSGPNGSVVSGSVAPASGGSRSRLLLVGAIGLVAVAVAGIAAGALALAGGPGSTTGSTAAPSASLPSPTDPGYGDRSTSTPLAPATASQNTVRSTSTTLRPSTSSAPTTVRSSSSSSRLRTTTTAVRSTTTGNRSTTSATSPTSTTSTTEYQSSTTTAATTTTAYTTSTTAATTTTAYTPEPTTTIRIIPTVRPTIIVPPTLPPAYRE